MDNQNIIAKVLLKYKHQLPSDTLEECGMIALWKALQYHDPSYKSKFTTSLYQFVDWECLSELRKIRGRSGNKPQMVAFSDYDVAPNLLTISEEIYGANMNRQDATIDVRDKLGKLKEKYRSLIEMYYLKGMTLSQVANAKGVSKEAARQMMKRAIGLLKRMTRSKTPETV